MQHKKSFTAAEIEEYMSKFKNEIDLVPDDCIFTLNRLNTSKHKWDDNQKQWVISTPDSPDNLDYYRVFEERFKGRNDVYKTEYLATFNNIELELKRDCLKLNTSSANKLKDYCLDWENKVSRVFGIDAKWISDEPKTATEIFRKEQANDK